MTKTKGPRRHRAALDKHTECGIPLDKAGLSYDESDCKTPPTCRRCLSKLTRYCGTCKKDTVRNRILTCMLPSVVVPETSPMEDLVCECGYVGLGNTEIPGAAQQERNTRERRAAARIQLQAKEFARAKQLSEDMTKEQAEYPFPDTCAFCDKPLPLPLGIMHQDHQAHSGFVKTKLGFLPIYYCIEHRELGKELDLTLAATFKASAIEIMEGAAQRVRAQERNR